MSQMSKRTYWSQEEIDDYSDWHEKLMVSLNYPEEIKTELRRYRVKFLAGLLKKK